jgi:hypothetical protein
MDGIFKLIRRGMPRISFSLNYSYKKFLKFLPLISAAIYFLSPVTSFAHEAYVLPRKVFDAGLATPINLSVFKALLNHQNLLITIYVTLGTILAIIIWFLFQHSSYGQKIDRFLIPYHDFGPFVVRLSIAAAFLG